MGPCRMSYQTLGLSPVRDRTVALGAPGGGQAGCALGLGVLVWGSLKCGLRAVWPWLSYSPAAPALSPSWGPGVNRAGQVVSLPLSAGLKVLTVGRWASRKVRLGSQVQLGLSALQG